MMTNRQPQQQRQGGRRHERRRSTYELHPPVLVGPEEDEEEEGFDDEVEGKLEQRRQPPQQEPQQAPLHHHHDDQQRKSKEGKIKMKQAARTHRKEGAEREEEKVEEAEEEEELFDERRANLTFLILGGGFLFAMIALLGIGIMDVVYGESLLVHALASLLIASISASVVVTYALGGRAAFSHHWRWFQPLRGGVRFVSLQIFSWTLFALSLALPTLPLILALFFPSSTFRGVILAAGLFAFVSQVVMATSIITYHEPQEQHADGGGEGGDQGGQQGRGKDRSGEGQARKGSEQDTAQQDTQEDEHRTDQHDKTAAAERAAATKRKAKRWAGKAPADGGKHKKHHEGDDKRKQKQQQQQQEEQVQEQEQAQDQEEEEEDARSVASAPGSIGYFLQSPQGHRWWTSFIGAQVLLSLTGLAYTVLLDVYIKHDAEPMLVFACLCCLTAAIFLTYGVGGRWAYSRKQWSFFQPFIGGPIFIALQMLAWTFFGTAAFVFLLHILRALSVCIPAYTDDVSALPTITTAGLAAFLAQVINVASLFVYTPPVTEPETRRHARHRFRFESTLPSTCEELFRHIVVWSIFNLEKYIIMFFAVSLFLCQFFPTLVVTTWALMGAAYVPTFARTPSVNGRRMLKSIVGHWVVVELEKYFQLAIYKNFDALPSDSRFIIGYHPHGIFPAACLYMTRTRQWQRMFPHVLPAVLSSSIVHYVPLFRDVLQLLGGYEVSRGVFISALRKHDSVVLVPGGQVEMISSRSDSNSITIDTSHRGFVKLALEQAARSNKPIYLLPTYGFNETRTLDNVRAPHAMQRFVTKALKANVIYLPYGQFGLPGYPRTVPVSVAIGEPVKVPPVHHPTRTQVDLVYRRYLDSLQAAFEAFKRDAGCEDDSLVFSPPEQTLDAGSFEDAWAAVKDDSNPTPKKHHPRHNGVEMLIMGSLLSFLFWTIVWTAYHQRHN